MKKILPSLYFALCAAPLAMTANAGNSDNADQSMELAEAFDVIQEYRELRESCAIGTYEQRRRCVGELSEASTLYREAKDVIAKQKLSTSESTLASYN